MTQIARARALTSEFFFQLLNPLTFLLFAGGLFSADAVRPSRSAQLLGYSYMVGAAAFITDILNEAFPPFVGIIPTTTIYTICAVLASAGFSYRYRGFAPWRLLIAAAVVHMAIYSYSHLVLQDFWFRSIEANVGAGVIFAIGLLHIRGRQERKIDRLIFALYAFTTIQCFVRPLFVVAFSGGEMTPETYSEELFLISMHLMVGLCATMTGMTLLVAYSMEIIEEYHCRSITDPLSGLFNRRGFEDEAARRMLAAERTSAPVGVIIADIDHFKRVNDTHGHDLGDMVIAELGSIFSLYAGSGRIAARLGGEEFALLLTGENGVDAIEVAEAIRRDFAGTAIETLDGACRLTASFGVAERHAGEDLRSILAKADEALYVAKASGRDRVCGEADVGVEKLKAVRDQLERRRNRAGRSPAEFVVGGRRAG